MGVANLILQHPLFARFTLKYTTVLSDDKNSAIIRPVKQKMRKKWRKSCR